MKKAVIQLGSKQYLVHEKQVLDVELQSKDAALSLKPLLVIDGENTTVGQPLLDKPIVSAKVQEEVKGDKVIAIRFKAKKRVNKRRGHRQNYSRIEITKIG